MKNAMKTWLAERPPGAEFNDAAFQEWLARKPTTWRDYYYRIDDSWKILAAFLLLGLVLDALGFRFVPD